MVKWFYCFVKFVPSNALNKDVYEIYHKDTTTHHQLLPTSTRFIRVKASAQARSSIISPNLSSRRDFLNQLIEEDEDEGETNLFIHYNLGHVLNCTSQSEIERGNGFIRLGGC
ncbi:hypothetical protein HAX54_014593 [Datura stramonium]|uniref:Uncharacterized protein n=1 Tax=Datura stramonium TaxID=4076 RepID=A0ABS8Y6D1_DATST|nr:hypothetical protein [Datura stramonium]